MSFLNSYIDLNGLIFFFNEHLLSVSRFQYFSVVFQDRPDGLGLVLFRFFKCFFMLLCHGNKSVFVFERSTVVNTFFIRH